MTNISASHGGKVDEQVHLLETMSSRNVRVAVVGNVDAGKSTLIGVLSTSKLDDGRGSSRTAMTQHKHEVATGRTSSVSYHILGFKENGEVVVPSDIRRVSKCDSEIARLAKRVVTLTDLAGHEKYLKTTIHGVSSGMQDYALILVDSKNPPTHMTMHHLKLVASSGIPIVVVLTKIDGCPRHVLKSTKEAVLDLLRAPEVGKKGYSVRTERDIHVVKDKMHSVAPIVSVSAVTGDGLDILRSLLFALPKRRQHHKKINRSFEFLVQDTFNVTGVGPVVSGFVNAGELRVGEAIYVGPQSDGSYLKTVVKSFHVAQTSVNHIWAGHSACIAFPIQKPHRKKLRKGAVILTEPVQPVQKFVAEICLLKGEGTTITPGVSQTMVHILHSKQASRVIDFEMKDNGLIHTTSVAGGVILRPGSIARVTFQFLFHPMYVRPNMRILFRDGHVRGIGIIKEVMV